MSTQAVAVERKLPRYFRSPDHAFPAPFDMAMRLSIPADAARIFQAFTQPEYLETWIAFPGDDADSYLVAWRQPDSYRFDHYRSGGRDLIVSGTYRFCRRRKMLFTWRMSGHREQAESLVYIRLFGNFSSTILELHHRGIASAADSLWLQEMWARSLDRLARLFPG